MAPSDERLVVDSWLQSLRHGDAAQRRLSRGAYLVGQRQVIDRLLARSEVRVAAWSQDPELVFGWACVEPARCVVHYVYVKHRYRQRGVARVLLADLVGRPCRYTHETLILTRAIQLPVGWVFDPYEVK